MHLTRLVVERLRILRTVDIEPGPGINIFTGANGSGKTSVLEGIYLLGTARSFRATRPRELVTRGEKRLLTRGEISLAGDERTVIGVEHGVGGARVRCSGEDVRSASLLARKLPLVLISPDSQRVLSDGAHLRRGVIDWALFHVEPTYGAMHAQFRRVLKQRNAYLRNDARSPSSGGAHAGIDPLRPWDQEFCIHGEKIDALRSAYLTRGLELFADFVGRLVQKNVDIRYYRGWSDEETLEEALDQGFVGDRQRGHTTAGPHRADLRFEVGGVPAHRVLSRGESKLFVIALLLSQAHFLRSERGENCIVLLDELASELDDFSRSRVQECLESLECQAFLTAVSPKLLGPGTTSGLLTFHVEQGSVSQVL